MNAPLATRDALRPDAAAVPAAEEGSRDAVFNRLSHLFRHAGSDVTMQALFRVLMDYRTGRNERAP